MSQVAPWVKYARTIAEMSQDDLAEAAGVSRATISLIEHGALPREPAKRSISTALGMTVPDLFPGDEQLSPHPVLKAMYRQSRRVRPRRPRPRAAAERKRPRRPSKAT